MVQKQLVYLLVLTTLFFACNKQSEITVQSPDGEKVPTGVYFYRFEAQGVGDHGGKVLVVQ